VGLPKALAVEAGLTPAASCSWPPPRTKPETNRPFEIMSIIDSSSASRTGFSASGSGLPSSIIFAVLVAAARIEAKTLHLACMQNGALWCSFSMKPSMPISSA
jgi:hypothetical protein